jgi:hypothetical protein
MSDPSTYIHTSYGLATLPPPRPKETQSNYYNNFSKYVLANTMQPTAPAEPAFTYDQYKKSELHIEKYKLPDLKVVAKHYKLHVSGNKPVLVDRILSFFRQTTSAISIQSHFRGSIVRLQSRLRGVAYSDSSKCVNECDFYTLEPLREIDHMRFFSYTDDKGFVYGFDMFSLMTLLKKTSKIINPYNREQIPFEICSSLLRVYNISRILFPHIFISENAFNVVEPVPRLTQRRINRITPTTNPRANPTTIPENTTNEVSETPDSVYLPIPVYEDPVFDMQLPRETVVSNILSAIRAQPLDVRIRELFMEINLLGNYAESRWFADLDRLRLARFYQFYYDWWNGRSRLSSTIRRNICVLGDPFTDIRLVYLYPTTDETEYREACVKLMETMVYAGIDVEYRKLGVLQLLSILTIVSIPARNAMPWLYESLLM